MTGMFRRARVSLTVLAAVTFLSMGNLFAFQDEVGSPVSPQTGRLALLNDVYSPAMVEPAKSPVTPTVKSPETPIANEPIPFTASTMANDVVPPFPALPELTPAVLPKEELSFEENMPVESKKDSVDECCKELSGMIAGNLESNISLEAKTMMIETAMKMMAKNIELKAEAKITALKAEHALEIARMQSQMMQMRSMGNAADQINRVAGPLSQMLQRNYQQSVAMNEASQQISRSLAQIGYEKLQKDAQVARANRQRIQLTSPKPASAPSTKESDYQWRIARLTQQLSYLQDQLQLQNQTRPSSVAPASYSQPLQPRRQPLEPMPSCEACSKPQSSANKREELPLPFSVNDGVQYLQFGPEFRLSREAAALKESRALNGASR